MKIIRCIALALPFLASSMSMGQDAPTSGSTHFDNAAADARRQLDESLAELAALREELANEKLPLTRKLSELERELIDAGAKHQQTTRLLDTRTLGLSNLRNEVKSRREEWTYLHNLLGEYIRNFESRLHIAELQQYRKTLDAAKLAPENSNLNEHDVHRLQAALLDASLARLENALGGERFEGSAVGDGGLVKHGAFVLVGPAAIFRSNDGQTVGTADQRLGSLEPTITEFDTLEDAKAAADVVANSTGVFVLDPTLGNAHKIADTQETWMEHVQKGGPVMIPIFVLAGLTALIIVVKWIGLLLVRRPSRKRVHALLQSVGSGDVEAARQRAKSLRGPIGAMLRSGVENLGQPRELVEEVMYERVIATRLKLQRFLPFIAIAAAAAPLLGLLGTVTGIMNTFTLITVFGTGDVKTLSSGISEALITTEYGLIVAIPALLIHAFLARKARAMIDQMEKSALAFANQASRGFPAATTIAPANEESRLDQRSAHVPTNEQLRDALVNLLAPIVNAGVDQRESHAGSHDVAAMRPATAPAAPPTHPQHPVRREMVATGSRSG